MTRHLKDLKILLVEDDPGDVDYFREIVSDEMNVDEMLETAQTLSEAMELLQNSHFDLVILDLGLPDSIGLKTFQTLHSSFPDTPVLVLTGLDDADTAVEAVSEGAQDYLAKGTWEQRILIRSMRYAIERQKLLLELKRANEQIETLSGIIPICSHCKSIRNDAGYWQAVEKYVTEHSKAQFSHGVCPDCMRKYYPEFADDILGQSESK